jgi:hypothetical protein
MRQKCVLFSEYKDTYLQSLRNKTAPRPRGLQTQSQIKLNIYIVYNCRSQPAV